jgi:hypothetical protein
MGHARHLAGALSRTERGNFASWSNKPKNTMKELNLASISDKQIPLDTVREVWAAAYDCRLDSNEFDPAAKVHDGDVTHLIDYHFVGRLSDHYRFLMRLPLLSRPFIVIHILSRLMAALDDDDESNQ